MLPYIHTPFAYIAGQIGASPDELKVIFAVLIAYPLAAVLKRIPDNRPDLKNLFSVAVSTFFLVGLFDLWSGAANLILDAAGAYLIASYIEGPYMPWIGFVFLMGHLSVSHIYRHIVNDPGVVDVTGAQMVLVMKLSAFCWNVHDGKLPEKDLEGFQKEHSLRELPSLLDYVGYVSFFPALFAGPACDFVDYQRWLETSIFALPPGVDPSKAPPTRKKRKIPRSGTPAAIKCAVGLFWIIAFLKLSAWYNPDLAVGETFLSYSFPRRVWFLWWMGFTTRTKFYGIWSLTEGSCILSGIGYNGIDPKTGRADWSKLQNVNALGVELAQNTRAYLGNWNMNTNNWLRNCIYLRVTPKGKKPGFRASLATFATSAFWHGFEPGYYLAFILAAFLQTVAKNCRRYIRPFFMTTDGQSPLPSKRYYDIASWFVTHVAFAYTVAPFVLLTWTRCFTVWYRVYFYCVIGVIACFGLFSAPGKSFLKSRLAKQNRDPAAASKAKHPITTGNTSNSSSNNTTNDARIQAEAEAVLRTAIEKAGGPPEWLDSVTGKRVGAHRSEDEGHRTAYDRTVGVGGHLGIADDPEADLDELMEEVKREVELRRERGMSVGQGLQETVQARVREVLASMEKGKGSGSRTGGQGVNELRERRN